MTDDESPAVVGPTRGQIFTHSTFRRLLPDGTKGFAVMKVTAVRRGEVFYTYADSPTNKGDWRMPIENWLKRYGNHRQLGTSRLRPGNSSMRGTEQ
ncbi:hypothetical protein [Mycobacteroides chelonae]|uniref:hypothetical protein n=1 Tax=Mycobacteroides chelonae TaxID=1774 RepID=UPI001F1B4645|nr:hypothetical protein [Mycobacteroides chelonae]